MISYSIEFELLTWQKTATSYMIRRYLESICSFMV